MIAMSHVRGPGTEGSRHEGSRVRDQTLRAEWEIRNLLSYLFGLFANSIDVSLVIHSHDNSHSLNLYLRGQSPINRVERFSCVTKLILTFVARKERQKASFIDCGSVKMIHLPSLLRISVQMRA